jgi:hypothetical protein
LIEGGQIMTYEEAEQAAIDAGALEPQGMAERIACGLQKNEDWSFQWADTAKAQGRLKAWTNAVLNGIPPYELKSRLG